ncbi:MAG: TerC family protein [Labilithrix sp.]|nr:TerC family protein [Labilithrix sp.]MBX3219370.1 TerC family protein [Labilithrix sp.]
MDWVAPLITLTLMEVVLGIDNIVFLSILIGALPEERKPTARFIGLGLALVARIALLLGIKWVMGLDVAVFHWSSVGWVPEGWVENHQVDAVTGKDLVLLGGGLFLIGKSVVEIHKKTMGGDEDEISDKAKKASFAGVIAQIVVLDLVFSLDSVISAIGMANDVWVMVVAMLVAVAFMAVFSGRVSAFIDANPTFKMLALTFLVMIGVLLLAEGAGTHINKGYIYGAMVFSLLVELLNMRARRKKDAKKKHELAEEHAAAAERRSVA